MSTDPIIVTEMINGREFRVKIRSCYNSERMAERYKELRKECVELGLEGAKQKWHDDEAKERRKLGLEVKDRY